MNERSGIIYDLTRRFTSAWTGGPVEWRGTPLGPSIETDLDDYFIISPKATDYCPNKLSFVWIGTVDAVSAADKGILLVGQKDDNTTGYDWGVYKGSTETLNVYFRDSGGTGSSVTVHSGITIGDGTIHHVIGTYDGATVKGYYNGVYKGSNTNASGPLQSDWPFYIGASWADGIRWARTRTICLLLYNDALSASATAQLHRDPYCMFRDDWLLYFGAIGEVVSTEAPTTEAPTTEAPTTEAPTTEAPTTLQETTQPPTTYSPPSTPPPTTSSVATTPPPSTQAPTTEAPTTEAPTTEAPTTEAPTTEAPTTEAPTTEAPTTEAPTTEAPSTLAPSTLGPTTTAAPTTVGPTTTAGPTTIAPTTALPFAIEELFNQYYITGTTSTSQEVTDEDVFVKYVRWWRPLVVGHKLSLTDGSGNQKVLEYCDDADQSINIPIYGIFRGIKIDDLDSGEVFIYCIREKANI